MTKERKKKRKERKRRKWGFVPVTFPLTILREKEKKNREERRGEDSVTARRVIKGKE